MRLNEPVVIPLDERRVTFRHRGRPPDLRGLTRIPVALNVAWGDVLACSLMVGHRDIGQMRRHGSASLFDALRRYATVSASLELGGTPPTQLSAFSPARRLLQHSTLYRDADLSEHIYFSYVLGLSMALLVTQERFGRTFLEHFDSATRTAVGKRPDLITPAPGSPRIVVEAKGTRGRKGLARRHMIAGSTQILAGKALVRAKATPFGAVAVSDFSIPASRTTGAVGSLIMHVHHDMPSTRPRPRLLQQTRGGAIDQLDQLRDSVARLWPGTLATSFGGVAAFVARTALTPGVAVRRVGTEGGDFISAYDVATDTWIGLEEFALDRTLVSLAGIGVLDEGTLADVRGVVRGPASRVGYLEPYHQHVRGPIVLAR